MDALNLGQLVTVRGSVARIIAVHAAGTFDVQMVDSGKCFRVTGCATTKKAPKPRIAVACMECGKKFATSNECPECPRCGGVDIDVR